MSEIQRFGLVPRQDGLFGVSLSEDSRGTYVRYTDLRRSERQCNYMAALVIVVSTAFLAYIFFHPHEHQPTTKILVEETTKKMELLNDLKANHERTLANVEIANKVYHRSAKDLDRLKGLEEMNANPKAQLIEQNKKLSPQQQTENLKLAASTMHDKDIQALAREVGFTGKVRVTNE